jgi:flagellar protein FliS
MTYATASHDVYRESAILTAPPERLVVLLYDGCHRFLLQAAAAMRAEQQAEAGERLRRAGAIIDELQSSLDLSAGEVAERLQGVYVFCRRHLSEALVERDPSKIDAVDRLLGDLREAWSEIAAAQVSAPAA